MEENSTGGGLAVLIIIGIVIWIFIAVQPGRWQGLYEDKEVYGPIHTTSEFESKEACLQWKEDAINLGRFANPECGRKCEKPKTTNGPYKCAETALLREQRTIL